MDYVVYMNAYTNAIEAMNDFDQDEAAAMEGFKSEIDNVANEYTTAYSQLIARFQTAVSSKNKAEALKAIDDLDKLLGQTMQKAREVPKDHFAGIKFIAKVALAVAGLFLIIKSKDINAMVKNLFMKSPIPKTISNAIGMSKTATKVTKTALNVAKAHPTATRRALGAANFFVGIDAGGIGFKALFKGGKSALNDIQAGSRKEFVEKYGDQPNASSALYRKFYSMLQNEKAMISRLKQEVNEYFTSNT